MTAGTHDQRLAFDHLTATTDEMGSVTEEWVEVAAVWGEVIADKSEESVQASQRTGSQILIMRVRADEFTRNIQAKDRVRWKEQIFDLSPPRPTPAGRPEFIEFTATGEAVGG